jgi:hypothetical protein
MAYQQKAGQNHNIKIANTILENVAKLRHLGMRVTNENWIHGQIKSKLNMGSAYYSSEAFVYLPTV